MREEYGGRRVRPDRVHGDLSGQRRNIRRKSPRNPAALRDTPRDLTMPRQEADQAIECWETDGGNVRFAPTSTRGRRFGALRLPFRRFAAQRRSSGVIGPPTACGASTGDRALSGGAAAGFALRLAGRGRAHRWRARRRRAQQLQPSRSRQAAPDVMRAVSDPTVGGHR